MKSLLVLLPLFIVSTANADTFENRIATLEGKVDSLTQRVRNLENQSTPSSSWSCLGYCFTGYMRNYFEWIEITSEGNTLAQAWTAFKNKCQGGEIKTKKNDKNSPDANPTDSCFRN